MGDSVDPVVPAGVWKTTGCAGDAGAD
jgi:hypothetical protein